MDLSAFSMGFFFFRSSHALLFPEGEGGVCNLYFFFVYSIFTYGAFDLIIAIPATISPSPFG